MSSMNFTNKLDVQTALSGHQDRFKSAVGFIAACNSVWGAARGTKTGAEISCVDAAAIMEDAIDAAE